MIVRLDTNTLVQGTAAGHPYHTILNAWVAGQFTRAFSNSILLEYEEIHRRLHRAARWHRLLQLIELAELTQGNVLHVAPAFAFHTIPDDADDNKFADCAIAANADFVITDDHHFAPLAKAGCRPQPITPHEFIVRFLRTPG